MKKRLFGIVTALIMICSFVGVMPQIEVEAKNITVFQQTDSRWSSHSYGYSNTAGTVRATIGSGGCGILAYVNAVYYMNGSFIDPITLADWSVANGHRVNGEGTAYSLYKSFANTYGSKYNIKFTGTTSSFSTLKAHLQKGGTAIYGAPDHIMCVVDYNASNGKYLLLDSYKSSNRGTYSTGGYRWLTQSEFTGKVAVNVAFHMIENRTSVPDPDPHPLSDYLPLTAYLWENKTAYVSTGEIWAEDKCTITAIYDNGTCDVTYPTGNTTKSVNTSLSYFIPNVSSNLEKVTAPGKINVYSRPDMSVNIGYTDPGDSCVKVSSSGDKAQIIYPISGGFKLGWINASDLGPVVTTAAQTTPKVTTTKPVISNQFSAYLPLTAYLWENKTAYVSTGEIWAEDKCTINAVYSNGTCDVTYPTSGGSKNVNMSLSYFIPNAFAQFEKVTAPGQIYAYSRPDMSVNIGYTDPGDSCVIVSKSGDKAQIIYPTSSGFKLGWVNSNEITPVVTTAAQTTPKVTTTKTTASAPNPNQFSAYLPLKAYLWENETVYVPTGEIWTEDKCTINAVYSNGTCDVTYPTSSGSKNVNMSLSYFIPNAFAQFEKVTAAEKILVYSRPDMSVNIGYTDPGDSCVIVSESDGMTQIIYPISGGFKLGWVDINITPVVTTTVQTAPKATTKTTIVTTKPTTTTTTTKATANITTVTAAITVTTYATTNKVTTKTTTEATTETVAVTTAQVTESCVLGDANSDNELNLRDVVILRRYIAGGWQDAINKNAADMNGDNEINLKDVVLQRRKIVGGWESAVNPAERYSSFVYGSSENGRDLICHSITPEKYDRTILMNFEIHGFEDDYAKDGQVLVDTAEKLIEYYKEYENLSTRILIIPSANPDGLLDGTTKNGFGRCNAKGIDLNRDFDANYKPNTTQGRNYTPYAFSASESRALRDLCLEYKPEIVLDFHGWLDYTIGDIELAEVFYQEMGLSHHVSFTDSNASGYFANWAHQQGSLGLLVEFTNDNIPYENLVSALDRLVTGNYDNGQGEYEEDERFSQFDSISTYTLLSENVTTYMGFNVPFNTTSYIDGATDLCTIQKIYKNGWVKINYPVSSGTKTAYAKLSDFISEESITEFKNANVSDNTTVYRRSNMTETIGSVWTTDEFIVIAETDNMVQIVYPLDAGGWKMGWIEKSALI